MDHRYYVALFCTASILFTNDAAGSEIIFDEFIDEALVVSPERDSVFLETEAVGDLGATRGIRIFSSPGPYSDMTFTPDGRLFAVQSQHGRVVEIAPDTGIVTNIGDIPGMNNGLVGIFYVVPEPSGFSIVLSASICLFGRFPPKKRTF